MQLDFGILPLTVSEIIFYQKILMYQIIWNNSIPSAKNETISVDK